MVEASLQLDWDPDSMVLTDDAGEAASFPLESGEKYTMTLDVKSTRGTGDVSFTCKNSQNTWDTIDVSIANLVIVQRFRVRSQHLGRCPSFS